LQAVKPTTISGVAQYITGYQRRIQIPDDRDVHSFEISRDDQTPRAAIIGQSLIGKDYEPNDASCEVSRIDFHPRAVSV
jgi:hypothetical protein